MQTYCTTSLSVAATIAALGMGTLVGAQTVPGPMQNTMPDGGVAAHKLTDLEDSGPTIFGPQVKFGGAVYDNGPANGANGLSHLQGLGLDRTMADDFELGGGALIGTVAISGVWNGGSGAPGPVGAFRVRFWPDVSGQPAQPGNEISDQAISMAQVTAVNTGAVFFGRPEVRYTIVLNDPVALNGNTRYWVGIQPTGATDNFFHLTSADGANINFNQVQLWWQGAPAHPAWTPGSPAVFATPYDVTFQLFAGEEELEGACCTGDGPDDCEILSPDDCAKQDGQYLGHFTSCALCPVPVVCEAAPACPWNIAGDDDVVDVLDLLALLDAWGPNPGHPADFDGSGVVDVLDLLKLLDNWGPCPQGDGDGETFDEGEPCGDDVNGGCNMAQPNWTSITCGDTVCGTAWADDGTRDTDWYELQLAEDAVVTWQVHAEFPALAIIANVDCDNFVIIESDTSPAGVPFEISACLPAGKYTLFVAPSSFEGVECDVNSEYKATVKCANQPCPGGCCLPDQDCLDDITQGDCNALGGLFLGVDSSCEGVFCPRPQLECPQPNNEIFENETCGIRENDGCNQDPASYGTACCNHVIHGTAWTDEINGVLTRDTDWYTLKLSEETCLTIWMEYNFGVLDAAMFLINDQCGDGLAVVASSVDVGNNTRRLRATIPAGTYRIFAAPPFPPPGGMPCPAGGTYTLTVECDDDDVPCSDTGFLCTEALEVEIDEPALIVNNTGFAATAPACGGFTAQPGTVWFKVVGDGTTLTAESCGSSVAGTVMTVYCGSCTVLECIDGSNEDGTFNCANPGHASVEWCSELGLTYFIALRGSGGAIGDLNLQVTSDGFACSDPPPQCELDCRFIYDTGGSTTAIGWTTGNRIFAWLHRFEAPPSGDVINEIKTTYGFPGGSSGLAPGDPVGWAVYEGVAANGRPETFLFGNIGTIDGSAIHSNNRQSHAVPSVPVSGTFWVMVYVHQGGDAGQGFFPAPLDGMAGPPGGTVWGAGSTAGTGGIGDPNSDWDITDPASWNAWLDLNDFFDGAWLMCAD